MELDFCDYLPGDSRGFQEARLGHHLSSLVDVPYPTTDQVYPDPNLPSASVGFVPGIYDYGDVLFPIFDCETISVPPEPEQLPVEDSLLDLSTNNQRSAVEPSPPVVEKPQPKKTPQQKIFACPHCKKQFRKNFDFCQHLRSHTGEKPFICIVCGLAFTQKCNVKKHLLSHLEWNPHGNNKEAFGVSGHLPRQTLNGESLDKGFECRFCSIQPFRTYAEFRAHLKKHMEEKVFQCIYPPCTETPKTVEDLLYHVKQHEGHEEYKCVACGALFYNLYQYSFHNHAHRQLEINRTQQVAGTTQRLLYKCELCPERFAEPEELKVHREAKDHLFKCPGCESKFSQERYLRRHLPVHETNGGHLCEKCGKSFKLKHHLNSHILIHNGKLFACHICTKAFARPDQVVRHVKAVHEPRAFKCDACLKTFSRKDKLKEHLLYKSTRCVPLQQAASAGPSKPSG